MPDKGDFGSSESHETLPGGERVLIRRARPEDVALYPDFLADVSAEDLRLRFFARVAELSSEESDKLIPVPIDQNPCAHWRSPMDMMRQG